MNCEQFEIAILDLERNGAVTALERAAALAHLNTCPRCAALQESWQSARQELRALSEAALDAQTPARVEMRLRQEFRARHRTFASRRPGLVAAWALAAAGVFVGAVSWIHWQNTRSREATQHQMVVPVEPRKDSTVSASNDAGANNAPSNDSYPAISAEDNGPDFTPLPGALLAETDQAAVVRVRMQRGTLAALGFPVSEENVGEWIQVDLMVGDDGVPQAVRLAQ